MSDVIFKTNNITDDFLKSIGNPDTKSVLQELSDSALKIGTKSFLNSTILEKFPIIGAIAAVSNGILDFKDRLYTRKMASFLIETSNVTDDDRRIFGEKIQKDPEECRKAALAVLDIIDKIIGEEKAVMVGKIVCAFMREPKLSPAQLVNLCEIIERAYLQDLIDIRDDNPFNDSNLEAVGIKKPIRHEDIDKAILAALEQAKEQTGVLREAFVPEIKLKTTVDRSGLTDNGATLVRILRSY